VKDIIPAKTDPRAGGINPMYANTCWGLLCLAATFGLAVLGLPPNYDWLAPWLVATAGVCGLGSAICFAWPLRHKANRDKVVALFEHPREILKLIEPTHILALGLAVAVAGFVWQIGRASVSAAASPTPAGMRSAGDASFSLEQLVRDFLAKTGKSGDFSPSPAPGNFYLSSDENGQFIQYWGAALGPWPTTSDTGFTAVHLKLLPG
jgi:hypothetical protein